MSCQGSYTCEYGYMQASPSQGFLQDGNFGQTFAQNCQGSPNGLGFVAVQGMNNFVGTPNGQGFVTPGSYGMSPNGQVFMPTNGNNFVSQMPSMTPNGQVCAMPTPNGSSFMASPSTQGFPTPNGSFMGQGSPNGHCFVPTPNGNNFLPQTQGWTQNCGQQPFPQFQQTFAPTFQPAAGEVSEKVLTWLSEKALETLGEVLAEEEDSASQTEEEIEEPYAVVSGLDANNVSKVAASVLELHSAHGTEQLADALISKACESDSALACANLLTVLLARLPQPNHRREATSAPHLLGCVVQRCHAGLEGCETETPLPGAHGLVLFVGELFNRQVVGIAEVKALFGKLVFDEDEHPLDHGAALACHLFLTCGSFLEKTALGRKLSEVMCSRLRELKGMSYTEATLFSLAHVTDLKLNKWDTSCKKEAKKLKKKKGKKDSPRDEKESPTVYEVSVEAKEAHVLRIGELFNSHSVAAPVVKELFSQLLFTHQPADASVELGRRLLSNVRETLAESPSGRTLEKYLELRLQELKPTGRAFSFCPQVVSVRS